MGKYRIWLFSLLFIVGLAAGIAGETSSANADTLHVGGTDPSNYSSIRAALDDASFGDTVFVHAGTYCENITLKGGVSLEGEGADVTTIIGQSIAGAPSIGVSADSITDAVVSGFTISITPGVAGSYGIYIDNSSVQLSRNVICDTETGLYAAGADVHILNNVFYLEGSTYGIRLEDSSGVVKNNIIIGCSSGIYVSGQFNVSVNYNDVYQCTRPYYPLDLGGSGAISEPPLFESPSNNNFHLDSLSPCIDTGDPEDPVPPNGGSRIDMGTFEYQYPLEIVEGPQANIITPYEVMIVWQTSIPCTGQVKYGMTADSFDQQAGDSTLSVVHQIALTGLSPSTTYQYYVRSADAFGNAVESEEGYFTTSAAPDYTPPSLQVTAPDLVTQPVVVNVAATDNIGIASVNFYVDDQLRYTFFGGSLDWIFDPSDLENGTHTLEVITSDKAGAQTSCQIPVKVALKQADVTLPAGGIISPTPESTVGGTNVSVEAWGLDPESGIDRILFYVDNQLLHVAMVNGEPGVEEHVSWQWNSYGAENNQDHDIRVEILNKADMAVSPTSLVHVQNTGSILDASDLPLFRFKFIKLTRGQVKREGVYYEAKLYVQNISPAILYDVTVYDKHAGFQAIQSDYGHAPRVRFEPDTFSSTVMYEIGRLMPGEVKECTINMATVLVSPDPLQFDYKIGKETEVTYMREVQAGGDYQFNSLIYHLPAVKTIEGWWGTEEIPLNTYTVLAPVYLRDYLVVTHPRKLYSLYNIVEVDALLSELAVFSRHKNAVLGYLNSQATRTELLNVEGHKNAVPISGTTNTGGWSSLMNPLWKYSGYMLLVGETEIIPSFTIIVTVPTGQYTVPLTDQPYADVNDDGYTDLILGRIVGNNAGELMTPVVTSVGVEQHSTGYGFDASHALLIGGRGNYEWSFIKNINDISNVLNIEYVPYLPNIKFQRTDYSDAQVAWNTLRPLFSGKDIVYFDGHGGPNGWGSVLGSDLVDDINFGNVNPGVFGLACSTGEYEVEDDSSLAEAFLQHGAGLYVGATRMTNTGYNAGNGLSFFRNFWRPWVGMGLAWRNLERNIWTDWHNWRFSLAYNIYGDPKFGYGGTGNLMAETTNKTKDADTPPEGIVLELPPEYTVTSSGGIDYVEIPGCETLIEPGQYQVPFLINKIDIPSGYVVQGVEMVDRSELQTSSGLCLPISPDDFMENDDGEPFIPDEYLWYPDVPFRWEVIPGESQGSTLQLMVYPFLYNTETTESKYYTHHEFNFSITKSFAEITAASVEKKAVLPGQPVNILLEIKNLSGQPVTVRLRAVIAPYAGTLNIAGLPIHTMELPPGRSALKESWDTTGVPDGPYKLMVVLEDTNGNKLDTADAQFTIGSDSADICYGDAEADGDVDGLDLAVFMDKDDLSGLGEFAATYGRLCY